MATRKRPTTPRKTRRYHDFKDAVEDLQTPDFQYLFTLEVVVRPADIGDRTLEDGLEYLRQVAGVSIVEVGIIDSKDPRAL